MLSKKRCPHTGIVNFFSQADPYMAVGSVRKAADESVFHWRFYGDEELTSGAVVDMKAAERCVASLYRQSVERDAHTIDEAA